MYLGEREVERYLTKHNASLDRSSAERFAEIEGTAFSKIRYSPDVELLHIYKKIGFWWALWSDGIITTANGLPKDLNVTSISADAETIIAAALESDSAFPSCGWLKLSRIKRICHRDICNVSNQLAKDLQIRERLFVEFNDGSKGEFLLFEGLNPDKYCFEIYEVDTDYTKSLFDAVAIGEAPSFRRNSTIRKANTKVEIHHY